MILSSIADNTIARLLAQDGLTDIEAHVLSYLLANGRERASTIARQVHLKRPTVYAALESLVEKGIITKSRAASVTIFSAPAPAALAELMRERADQRRSQIRENTEALVRQLSILPIKDRMEYAGLEIETIEFATGIYQQLAQWLMSGSFSAIFDPQIVVSAETKPVLQRFMNQTAVSKPLIREIAVAGPQLGWYRSQIRNSRHTVKEITRKHPFPADFILVESSVVFIDYKAQAETAIRIRHPQFFRTLQSTFELLWENLP